MNRFTMSNLALLMSYKVSPKEIEKIVDKLEIFPADQAAYTASLEKINVASAQVLIRRYASLQEYVEDMNAYVADAVNRRAQLVCFPGLAGLLPVSIMPQFDKSLAQVQPLAETGLPDPARLHEALSYVSDFAFEAYFNTMAALAARYRVFIMAGSSLYFDEDELCHRAFLFSYKGELVGYQDKLGLSKFEQELGINPATEVRVFETAVGPLAIVIGTDADYFEVARVAKNLGAKILLCPALFRGEYTPIRSAMGLNMRVQETKLYGVQSTLVGDAGLGVSLESGCNIYAPNEMVKQKNGVIARASGAYEPDLVCVPLDLDKLDLIANPYTVDKNRDFMHRYVDRLY